MTTPVRVLSAAEQDIAAAFTWYGRQRAGLGTEFIRELDRTLSAVSENPEHFAALRHSVRRARLKRFPYNVFFIVQEDVCLAIACLHGRRHPEALKNQMP